VTHRVQPTDRQWNDVEVRLSHAFGSAKFKCDGFDVTAQVTPVGKLRYGIALYVNGSFLGKWITEDCEERRRFMYARQYHIHGRTFQARMARIVGKKEAAQKYSGMGTQYSWAFPSFTAMKRHMLKHNQSVEIVEAS